MGGSLVIDASVGTVVRYKPHLSWAHNGLGTVVERADSDFSLCVKIKWLVDIQDIEGYEGNWYDAVDFEVNGGDIEIIKTKETSS
jgi:hypothetical protein